MKNRLFLLTTLLSVISYGQSKKEINASYRDEVGKLKNAYDSCVTVYLAAEKQLDQSRKNVRATLRLLDDQKQLINRNIGELARSAEKLVVLGVDVKPLISMEELNENAIPKYDPYQNSKQLFKEIFSYKVVYDTLQLEEMKIKEQNPLLQQQIEVYKSALTYNKETIIREKNTIRQLDSISNAFTAVKIQMEATGLYYQKKMNLLNEKLAELRENYRLKGPKGFSENYGLIFPDVFLKQLPTSSTEATLSVEGNIEADHGDWDVVAAPPTPPSPPMEKDPVISIVEEPAEFPGGMAAFKKYLSDNLVYPQTAKELGFEGKCYLKFIVSEDGSISDVKVVKGVPDCKECDYEAIRLIKAMPNWTPGKNGGKPVKQWYTAPVPFKLD